MTTLFNDPVVDPLPEEITDYVQAQVGENKKFKTVEDLAKGKYESDRHISNLEKELSEMRAELNTRLGVKDLLEQMRNTQNRTQPTPEPSLGNQPEILDESNDGDIETLIEKKLNARDALRQAERNEKEVQEQLKQTFGTEYIKVLKQKTEELGETPESMTALARKNPKLFLAIIGAVQQKKPRNDFFGVPQSSVSSSLRSGEQEKSWKYYEGIRKTDPSRYFSVEVQKQMHKDAQRLGESFYN